MNKTIKQELEKKLADITGFSISISLTQSEAQLEGSFTAAQLRRIAAAVDEFEILSRETTLIKDNIAAIIDGCEGEDWSFNGEDEVMSTSFDTGKATEQITAYILELLLSQLRKHPEL